MDWGKYYNIDAKTLEFLRDQTFKKIISLIIKNKKKNFCTNCNPCLGERGIMIN